MDAELERIVATLKAHLTAHPSAADTVDGVTSWWLADQHVSKALVEEALERLVDEGFASARRTASGIVIYGLRKAQ